MRLDVDVKKGLRRIRVEGELNIYNASDLKRELLDHLAAAPALEIDLAKINEIDTAGLQVLYLARREASGADKTLRIVAASPAVREAFELYNAATWFAAAAPT
jgi:anti-sigma B factor antagonist